MKEIEKNRMLNVLEKRFPGFKEGVCHVEISTPTTLNRYILKEGGSVAKVARKQLESKTGTSAISSNKASDYLISSKDKKSEE